MGLEEVHERVDKALMGIKASYLNDHGLSIVEKMKKIGAKVVLE